jgi:hypothetical protein
MSLTQRLSQWVVDNRARLDAAGAVTLRLSDPDIDKPSAHLHIQGSREAELILWDSGEVETWIEPMPNEEHNEIDNPDALEPFLLNFVDRLAYE